MSDFLNHQTISYFLLFAVPGIIALYARSRFLSGRMPPVAESAAIYLTLSLLYHASIYPIAWRAYLSPNEIQYPKLTWYFLIFGLPFALGGLSGYVAKRNAFRWILDKLKINITHPVATAWDWKFGNCPECWVKVTLKDDIKWYGFLGPNSFISTDPNERDILIQYVFNFDAEGKPWMPVGSSVWISRDEIQSIEFFPKLD